MYINSIENFKLENSFNERVKKSSMVIQKFDKECIPIYVEKLYKSNTPNITVNKFVVPRNTTVGKFIYELRKKMKKSKKYNSESSVFLLTNKKLFCSSQMIGQIYDQCKDVDGFLYMSYTGENTFGN
jgi:GABA(A) receptor-associated protein